jgi:TonB family protein
VKTRGPDGARRGALVLASLALGLAACADDGVSREPELLTLDSPFHYPIQLWDDGVEGETIIMVQVTDMGGVDSVYVLESSGQPAFDSAAVSGARELRFAPARRDERRVTSWARLPVRFHRNGDAVRPGSDPIAPEAMP